MPAKTSAPIEMHTIIAVKIHPWYNPAHPCEYVVAVCSYASAYG